MCEESYVNVFTMKVILKCYELASGLKINFHKSMLASINVDKASLYVYAKNLHCIIMRVPFKYLGLEDSLYIYAKTLHCIIMRVPFKYLGLEASGNPRKKRL